MVRPLSTRNIETKNENNEPVSATSLTEEESLYIFNKNAFHYLNSLLTSEKAEIVIRSLGNLHKVKIYTSDVTPDLAKAFTNFDPQYDYVNDYRRLLNAFSEDKDELMNNFMEQKKKLLAQHTSDNKQTKINDQFDKIMDFFIAIIRNDNQILKNTWEEYSKSEHKTESINTVTNDISNTNPFREDKSVSAKLKLSMAYMNTDPKRQLSSKVMQSYRQLTQKKTTEIKYQPMLRTSIPSVRKYEWNQLAEEPTEIRMGTQAQIKHEREINPLFSTYLKAQQAKYSDQDITHVYINNLKYHTHASNPKAQFERKTEHCLTEELHKAESRHSNLVLVTTPADTDVLKKSYTNKNIRKSAQEIKAHLLRIVTDIAFGNDHDFHMSEKARHVCGLGDEAQWSDLIDKSFDYFKIDPNSTDSLEGGTEQAIWNNFFRFQLAHHVIETTKPKTFNCSCKDGIDRGGASSFIYNLHMADQHNTPLDQTEIMMARDVAALQVKNRPANHHGNIMDAYKDYAQPFRMLELAQNSFNRGNDEQAKYYLDQIDIDSPEASTYYTDDQKDKINEATLDISNQIDPKRTLRTRSH